MPDELDVALASVVAAILARNRQPWWADALCREYPDLGWFPDPRTPARPELRDVCARCLVRDECLASAVERDEHDGVWAGTNLADRRRLRADAA